VCGWTIDDIIHPSAVGTVGGDDSVAAMVYVWRRPTSGDGLCDLELFLIFGLCDVLHIWPFWYYFTSFLALFHSAHFHNHLFHSNAVCSIFGILFCMYIHICHCLFWQFPTVYFPPQVKNKPHDEVAKMCISSRTQHRQADLHYCI
jgi:hypothetical protein